MARPSCPSPPCPPHPPPHPQRDAPHSGGTASPGPGPGTTPNTAHRSRCPREGAPHGTLHGIGSEARVPTRLFWKQRRPRSARRKQPYVSPAENASRGKVRAQTPHSRPSEGLSQCQFPHGDGRTQQAVRMPCRVLSGLGAHWTVTDQIMERDRGHPQQALPSHSSPRGPATALLAPAQRRH